MKKLAFVVNSLNIGGPQKALIGLLEELDSHRFDVTIISLQPGGSLREYVASRYRVIDAPPLAVALQVNRGSIRKDLALLLRTGHPRAAASYVRAIVGRLSGNSMNPWRQKVWAAHSGIIDRSKEAFDAAFAVSAGVSTYYSVDCINAPLKYHWVIGDYSQTPIDRATDLRYFQRTSGGLAVSDDCADIFGAIFPELSDLPIETFRLRTPWKYYASQEDRSVHDDFAGLRLLSVSRLDPQKGLDIAIDACLELKRWGMDFRWQVLGDGPAREEIEAAVAQYGLQDQFVLLGFQSNVPAFIRECDIFVHPSRSEGRSTAVDEAMSLHVPVILTNFRTAASQIQDQKTGLIVEMDGFALAQGISQLSSPATREKISDSLKQSQSDLGDASAVFERLSDGI